MIRAIIFDYYRTLYIPRHGITDTTTRLLHDLREQGIVLALLTRNETVQNNLSDPFFSFFSFIKCVEEDKTENDFKEIIVQTGVMKEEILIVGDRVKKEITLGNRLGIKTVWLRKGLYENEIPNTKEEDPWKMIKDLSEIKKFL